MRTASIVGREQKWKGYGEWQMSKRRSISFFLKNPGKMIKPMAMRGWLKWMPDRVFLKLAYRGETGKKLNLKKPVLFNEKLQWIKLYDRRPEYTTYVDKYVVREHVRQTIGEEYLIPLEAGPFNSPEEIPWNELPEQFVIKCTHGSSTNIVCKDRNTLDVGKCTTLLNQWLKKSWFWLGREWPYKNVPPRIIVEKYMVDDSGYELKDYKFYCFNGEAKLLMIASDRLTGKQKHFDYYDREGQVQNIVWGDVPNSPVPQPLPPKFEEMLAVAGKLSKGIPHVRVDLYLISGKIYFGEMTFFDASGFDTIEPEEWNVKLGSWIQLPNATEK